MPSWAELADGNPYPFAAKMAAKEQQSLEDILENPYNQINLMQQAKQQQQQNSYQNAQNQIAKQNAENQKAGLQLDAAQLQFSQQSQVANLIQEMMRQRVQQLLAAHQGQRGVSEMAGRLLDTRFNTQRQGLLDQLRLVQEKQNLDRLVDTSQSRARRLIGG